MADTLYRFRSEGVGDVISAFQRIGDAADKAGARVGKAMGARSPRGRSNAAGREQQQRLRAIDREAQQRRQRIKRAEDREIRDLERKLAKEARIEQRAMQQKIRAHERGQKAIERAEMQAIERRARAEDRVRQARRAGVGRVVGFVGRAALGAGLAGAALAGAATRQHMTNRDQAIRLAIQGGGNAKQLLKSSEQAAMSTPGATTAGVLGATEAFVAKTGNLDAAQQFQKIFAEIAVASSAPLEDIGSAAADLFEKFDIKSVEDMEDAMSALVVQGKRGAFELKNAAEQYPRLAAAASVFGMNGKEGLLKLGGLTQIARSATGGPEEAATALENMFKDLVNNSAEIEKKTGAKVFTDKTKRNTRDLFDILPEIIRGTGGNQEKLGELFDVRGKRAIAPLFTMFNKTIEEEKKAAAARGENIKESELLARAEEAVRKKLLEASDASGAYAEVQRDLAAAQEQSSVMLSSAWDGIVSKIGGELEPAVTAFAEMLSSDEFSGALGLAGDKVTEFASALEAGIDGLAEIPIIGQAIAKAREELRERALGKTPEERVQKAEERIAERARKRAGILRGFQAGDTEALAQIEALGKEDAADLGIINENAPIAKQQKAERTAELTPEEFVKRWVESEASENPTLGGSGVGRSLAEKEARTVAQRVTGGEEHATAWWMSSPNDEQKRMIEALQGQVQKSREEPGGGAAVPTDEVVAGLAALAQALATKAGEVKGITFKSGEGSAFQD